MKRNRDTKRHVRAQYADTVSRPDSSTASHEPRDDSIAYAESIGYSQQEMRSVPEGAAVTHGCGNPTAIAELKEGESVLDLGCGGGLDVFLAAQRVGRKGKVIGLDMTSEMVEKAWANARAGNYTNVEFGVAEIERLPLPDDSVDVVISNCVINHSQDKLAVFKEAYRVLKPGGRLFVSDLVTAGKLSAEVLRNADKLWTEWLSVACGRREYLNAIESPGFRAIAVVAERLFPLAEADVVLKGRIVSIQIKAQKVGKTMA
jgi:arsenite methyltransferase